MNYHQWRSACLRSTVKLGLKLYSTAFIGWNPILKRFKEHHGFHCTNICTHKINRQSAVAAGIEDVFSEHVDDEAYRSIHAMTTLQVRKTSLNVMYLIKIRMEEWGHLLSSTTLPWTRHRWGLVFLLGIWTPNTKMLFLHLVEWIANVILWKPVKKRLTSY